MRNSFYFFSDELKQASKKAIHQQGVVGKVQWYDFGNHNYTGLMDGGFSEAIMRFSESDFIVPESSGLAPSFAIKILSTGRHSTNVLTRVDFEPSDSWNFWLNKFKHRVNKPFEN